jgi:hypothetical protein
MNVLQRLVKKLREALIKEKVAVGDQMIVILKKEAHDELDV